MYVWEGDLGDCTLCTILDVLGTYSTKIVGLNEKDLAITVMR